jgi:hypothetical protein
MNDADSWLTVSGWLLNRAQTLREAAARAELPGTSMQFENASRAYARRLRRAAAMLERPLRIKRKR